MKFYALVCYLISAMLFGAVLTKLFWSPQTQQKNKPWIQYETLDVYQFSDKGKICFAQVSKNNSSMYCFDNIKPKFMSL